MDDFAPALRNLKLFNRMVLAHPELSKRLVRGEHDFLQWRQAKIFIAFREHDRKKNAPVGSKGSKRGLAPFLKFLFSGLVACALTAWAVLVRGRKDILIFSVDKISAEKDHDFRIDGLYRFLKENDLSYTEMFHTQLDRTMLPHARSRNRAAVYREAFAFMATVRFKWCRCRKEAKSIAAEVSYDAFDEADRKAARVLTEKLLGDLPASLFEIRRCRNVLRRVRPRAVLAIDDTRYYQELCAAAHAEGIPFYAFQHGHFTKYHAGWLSAGTPSAHDGQPDALFVWSPYWKKELLRLGTNLPENRIRVGGNPKGDAPARERPLYEPPSGVGRIGLLVPFESDVFHAELAAILKRLLETGRVKIFLKTRPDWERGEQMKRYGLTGLPIEQAEAVSDHVPVLSHVHAVAGVYTTFLYDALASMRPVFVFKTSVDVGDGMLVNGLADALDVSAADPAARLAELCREAAPKLEERLERYQGGAGSLRMTLEAVCHRA